jgi:alginate O-acetyltransferase complex protein AlgI
MVFSSLVFIILFLPATLLLYFTARRRSLKNLVLLAVSLLFYAWGEPRYIFLMMASIIVNWAIAHAISRSENWKKPILFFGIAVNLSAIAVFKYLGFLTENFNLLAGADFVVPEIVLPIGISFYTFQAISYLVDVYRGEVHAQKNPIFFGTYLAMFPQLIAGPIVRYKTIEHDLVNRSVTMQDFAQGLRRFGIGLAKKVLVANTMGRIADGLIEAGPAVGALPAWIAFIAYALQIYFDFSAYSDMAIGLGRMFGFRYLENFNYPYIARSVTDFWRRWHISLSSFFRDYVYIPLGGNRVGPVRWIVNLFIVWGLTGLWHGASWNFIAWGVYYGVLLGLEKLVMLSLIQRTPRVVQHLYVFLTFIAGWVIFRIENVSEIIAWFSSLTGAFGWGHPATLNVLNLLHLYPWLIFGVIGATPLIGNFLASIERHPTRAWCVDVWILLMVAWSIIELILGGFNPFIYFRF